MIVASSLYYGSLPLAMEIFFKDLKTRFYSGCLLHNCLGQRRETASLALHSEWWAKIKAAFLGKKIF